jgi:hypothetical protein
MNVSLASRNTQAHHFDHLVTQNSEIVSHLSLRPVCTFNRMSWVASMKLLFNHASVSVQVGIANKFQKDLWSTLCSMNLYFGLGGQEGRPLGWESWRGLLE